jgi:hypothetical protein
MSQIRDVTNEIAGDFYLVALRRHPIDRHAVLLRRNIPFAIASSSESSAPKPVDPSSTLVDGSDPGSTRVTKQTAGSYFCVTTVVCKQLAIGWRSPWIRNAISTSR